MFEAINLKKLVTSILIPVGVGFLSWLFTRGAMNVYGEINTPPLSPPSPLFPIVWSILYILMGISLYKVRMARINPEKKKSCLTLFAAQLAFNFFWSILFFNLKAYTFSAIWLGIMIILIILTIRCFKGADTAAAYLLVPYLLWCLFALYLNIGVAVLN